MGPLLKVHGSRRIKGDVRGLSSGPECGTAVVGSSAECQGPSQNVKQQ